LGLLTYFLINWLIISDKVAFIEIQVIILQKSGLLTSKMAENRSNLTEKRANFKQNGR